MKRENEESIRSLIDYLEEKQVLDQCVFPWDKSPEDESSEIPVTAQEARELASVDYRKLFPGNLNISAENSKKYEIGRDASENFHHESKSIFEIHELWDDILPQDPWDDEITEEEINDFFNEEDVYSQREYDIGEMMKGITGRYFKGSSPFSHKLCAYYLPIHFYGNAWGIYIMRACLLHIGKCIYRTLPYHLRNKIRHYKLPAKERVYRQFKRASFIYLYLHELFHHKVESFGIRLLVAEGCDRYISYKKNVYQTLYNTVDCLEEALANASSYKSLSQKTYTTSIWPEVRKLTRDFMKNYFLLMPPGYDQACNYFPDNNDFYRGQWNLQCMIQNGKLLHGDNALKWYLAPRMLHPFYDLKSKIVEIVPASKKPSLPTKASPFVSISSVKLIKACEKKGWKIKKGQGKGSHTKLHKDGKPRPITVAHRKEIIRPDLDNTLTSLGINEDELRDLM